MTPLLSISGEQPLRIIHKHWFLFVRDTLAFVIGGVFAPLAIGLIIAYGGLFSSATIASLGTYLPFVLALWFMIVWMALMMVWVNYYLDLWIITEAHVHNVEQIALFDRRVTTWNMDAILDVAVQVDGVIQEFLRFGTLRIATAGPRDEYATAEGIPHPQDVRTLILAHIGDRETLQRIAKQQEELLHTVSHEVKGHLAKSQAAFASIVEGDFGDVSAPLKAAAGLALADTRTGVETVMDILDGSNMATGELSIAHEPFDLKESVAHIFTEHRRDGEAKGLAMRFNAKEGAYPVEGDARKIEHNVIRNLVDNAIRYTPQGFVEMMLTKTEVMARLEVHDSGVGITREDMARLFTQGGHGTDSKKVNPSSTGFGLFVAKRIVEAHGGRIWAESGGANSGTRFFLELPLRKD
jgi:signal transduction histidine kinase